MTEPKIAKPGRYALAMDAYHGQPAVGWSFSASDAMIVAGMEPLTPAHVKAAWDAPQMRARKADLGTAIHALVLEPFRAAAQVVVIDAADYKKPANAELANQALAAGKTPLLRPDYERAKAIADRVLNHPRIGKWLAAGIAEQSCFARDEAHGIWVKCRPDFFTADRIVLDLKTVGGTSDKFLRNRITDGGWFMQAPWYCDVIERIDFEPPQDFFWVCVEQDEPHAIRIVRPPDDTMAAGGRENEKARAIFGRCARTHTWPAYPDAVESLGLTDFAHYRLEEDALAAPGMEAAQIAVATGANPFG
jgi:hypothetical protein